MEACMHNFGSAVNGWCTCEECGKKMRERDVKKMMEKRQEIPATEITEVQEEPITGTISRDSEVRSTNDLPTDGENGESKPVIEDEAKAEVKTKAKAEKEPKELIETVLSSGKVTTGPVCTIICDVCGAERIIKVQDKFQVTKCLACQKKALNAKRYQNRKANLAKKREAAKAEKEAQEIAGKATE